MAPTGGGGGGGSSELWVPRRIIVSRPILTLCSILIFVIQTCSSQSPPTLLSVTFSEGAIIGTHKLLELSQQQQSLTDADIISGNEEETFRLFKTLDQQQATIRFLYLETTRQLDREHRSRYDLEISTSSDILLKVTVHVLDINDNPPVFEVEEYSVEVNRTAAPGSSLVSVKAVDADAEKNAKVSYHLSSDKFSSHFILDADTGLLQTRSNLSCDYEEEDEKDDNNSKCPGCLRSLQSACSIVVYARDEGQPQQSAYAVVKVRVLDSNDHDPVVAFRYLPDQTKGFSVVETGVKEGTSVAAITVTDQDSGDFGETSLELLSGNEEGNFRLDAFGSNLYVVRVAKNPSFQRSDRFVLTVRATDKGVPQRRSVESQLVINVDDKNDFEPVFAREVYEVELDESTRIGSSVAVVQATDKDDDAASSSGNKNKVVYSITSGNQPAWFSIQPYSGLVTTVAALDRETAANFTLQVRAQDTGLQPRSAFATVKITLRDVNDQAPQFADVKKRVNVSEDAAAGTIVDRVQAIDRDLGANGTVVYRLQQVNRFFDVDNSTGDILVKSSLDREKTPSVNLEIVASDLGSPQLSSSVTVSVELLDVNDNSPTFYPSHMLVLIKEDNPVGEILVKARAEDPDSAQFSQVTYDFAAEADSPSFLALNKSNGEISVRQGQRIRAAIFEVTAKDSGGRKAIQNLKVQIVTEARVVSEPQLFSVAEDLSGSYADNEVRDIGQVEIGSSSSNSDSSFEILEGDPGGVFEIDNASGQLRSKKMLDREDKASYNLKIAHFAGAIITVRNVSVEVEDSNDNAPVFEDESVLAFEVDQNSPLGSNVYRVLARDDDSGENGRVNYILQDPHDQLAVDPKSGIITFKRRLPEQHLSGEPRMVVVTATDSGKPSLSNQRSYLVHYKLNNLYTPVFDFAHYEISISESAPPNSIFMSLVAVDKDQGDSVTYGIDSGDGELFGIFPGGELYLKKYLDREETAYHSIVVSATDRGIPARSSLTTVVIYVADENDNAPRFHSKNYVFNLGENEPAGSTIGRVSAADPDLGRNAELTYSFLTETDYFRMDPKTGFITSLRSVDRELLFQRQGQDYFQIDVLVSDNGILAQSDSASVNIVILDVNDRTPEFVEDFYEVSISEALKVGSDIITVHAKDEDKDDNGRIQYTLSSSTSSYLTIDTNSGLISLAKPVDRETVAKFSVNIVATDGGKQPLSSNVTLFVTVLDVNDNDPVFKEKDLRIELSEDTQPGHLVHRFEATDLDVGDNGKIRYYLGGTAQRSSFHLDATTGMLMLSAQLDREVQDEIHLVITAVDAGLPSRSSSASVTISVSDVNDNSPVFPATTFLVTIQEGIPVGSQIFKVEAADADKGENGQVEFHLKDSSSFSIDSKTGSLVTTAEIDREKVSRYELTVVATDGATNNRRSSEKTITVVVEDINDFAPEFVSLTSALILPGAAKGSLVLKAVARDEDESSNGIVTYSLQQQGSSAPVDIDRQTGQITLTRDVVTPDKEPVTLVVVARDNAVQSARLTATTTITLLGGREKPGPSFTKEMYQASLKENSPAGTPVMSVELSDQTRVAKFYLTGCESEMGGKDRDLFKVDPSTGQVRSSRPIDREREGNRIVLDIVAFVDDEMSGCKVEITCLDENDSAPVFKSDLEVVLSESFLPGGHFLTKMQAEDADLNPQLSYKLSLSAQTFLSIDEFTGALTLNQSIDREIHSELDVEITVSDGLHETVWKKTIEVQDVNDNAPVFTAPQFSFDIFESATRGAIVGRIEAKDLDKEPNFRQLSYRLVSDWGSDTFSMDPSTGIITLSAALGLDREDIEHYVLIASASDGGNPALTATATVFVNVLDVNDNPPAIEKSVYSLRVREDVPVGSVLTRIMATDPDSDSGDNLFFHLEEAYRQKFSISPNGTLLTLSPLDREKDESYTFRVTVTDSEEDGLSSTCMVEITVEDVNDESPRFEGQQQQLSVLENAPPNTPIAKFSASDADVGRNAEVHFLLEDSFSMRFSVGRVDGVLRSEVTLDREDKDSYELVVTAVDNGSPSLSSKVNIVIQVEDVNDNMPVFNPKYYSARVPENSSVGLHVLETKAFDLDSGINGRLRYSIISGNSEGDFAIGELSGIIKVNKKLDYERRSSYELTVQAEDGGKEVKYDTASVAITIQDVNDNAPEFVHSPYTVTVMENSAVTADVALFRAAARDRDDPPNNKIEYSIRDDSGLFSINASTGDVYLREALDREAKEQYRLEVFAQDSGTPRLTSTGILNVVVVDENDNAPEFENDVYEFSVNEEEAINFMVGKVSARDLDSGENARIRYNFAEESPSFRIDENSGEIFVSALLDRERTDSYTMSVIARDSSPFTALTSSTSVTIRVEDANDNAPEILDTQTDFFIPPTTAEGTFVLGVSASDKDSGRNGELTFSLTGRDAHHFQIDPVNGAVLASSSFSQKMSYQILVTVADNGRPSQLSKTQKYEIFMAKEITVPNFGDFKTAVSVAEDLEVGSVVATVKAVEEDVAFGIAGGNSGHKFSVNNETGEVSLRDSLDYETTDYYELWVKVYFKRKPLFFQATKIVFTVEDVNDNPPVFPSLLRRVNVAEEQFPPFFVAEMQATDRDQGQNSVITYQLIKEEATDDLFEIDSNSGVITCNARLDREKLSHFRLKVKATDSSATAPLSGTATVLVQVDDINDNAPLFSRLYSVNVTENAAAGTVLLRVETRDADTAPNANVSYHLVQEEEDFATFAIDTRTGELSVANGGQLDREVRDEFALKVQASDGAWKLDTTISVLVLDENDNTPTFDQSVYEFSYKSNTSSSVGRVNALDRDSTGPNSMVSYSLSHASDLFDLDSSSGMISVRSKLPFSRNTNADNSFQLSVLATDLGSPPRSSHCEVQIYVVEEEGLRDAVPNFDTPKGNESALPSNMPNGSVVLELKASDDVDRRLQYRIVGGNGSDLLAIDEETGVLTTRQLITAADEGVVLFLNLSVADEGNPYLASFATHIFRVTPENLHAPKFPSDSTRIYIREDEPVGNAIVTLAATDEDEGLNGQIVYAIIDGDEKGTFRVDGGKMFIQQSLDYEKIPVYNLMVEARDLGFKSKSATSSVKVVLQDVDDNAPYFEEPKMTANIKENSEPGTLVTQVIAVDADSPKFAQIEYSILEEQDNFKIDPNTGIIVSTRVLDFEQVAAYYLTVQARNPGSEQLASSEMTILVSDENEFVPQFLQPIFQFAISESSAVGSAIGKVEAEDRDSGKEGEIFYFFVGASNAAGFAMDRKTGIISVNEQLDRESQNRYVLTVLAKNHGSIRGNDTDEAQVIIQVQDGNDPPVFVKEQYAAEVAEDAALASSVLTVAAVDKDVRPRNSQFSYSIALGNEEGNFEIDPTSGQITLVGQLDRESVPAYNLTIQAIDNGSPPATGETAVLITVSDINDSAPELNETTGNIKENSPVGSFVMQLNAHDADMEPNTGPFKYTLESSESSDLFSMEENTGVLRTSAVFDRESTAEFELRVQVQDSGRPPLSATFPLKVQVLDENDNPSAARSIVVIIKSFKGIFPGGNISAIRPADPDTRGDYQCRLVKGSENIFEVQSDCQVTAGRIQNGREYELSVTVNDGRHPDVQVEARLNFVPFSQYASDQSVAVRYHNATLSKVLGFFESLRSSASDARLPDLLSLSQHDEATVDSLLALKENDLVLPKADMLEYLSKQLTAASNHFTPEQVSVNFNPCQEQPCLHEGECSATTALLPYSEIAEFGDTIFNSPKFEQTVTCKCKRQFSGKLCEEQRNACDPNPCQAEGQCIPDGNRGFRCQCPPLRGGKTCEVESINACMPNPCMNGGTCRGGSRDRDAFCLCRPGYQGDRCQTIVDSCRTNPCQNGGTCVSLKPNYRCRCLDNYYGNHCELATLGFGELSFAALRPLDPNANDVSVIFTTTKAQALLVYNFGQSVGGRSDFLALELTEGRPRLSWGGARTAITRIELDRKVNSGRWYKLTATRLNQVGTLSLEDCTESGEYCKTCQPDDAGCFKKATGEAGTLTFHGNPMYFGGMASTASYSERLGQVSSVDFVGCIKSLSLNGFEKNLFTDSLNKTGIRNTCNQVEGGACGKGGECGHYGTCIPLWSHHKCQCDGGIVAANCDSAFEPFSLTEKAGLRFHPTERYRQTIGLDSRLLDFVVPGSSLSLSFRTLVPAGSLLSVVHRDQSSTSLDILDGVLVYRSASKGKPEINMTSGMEVSDGQWHSAGLQVNNNSLQLMLDGQPVGFEVEFSAAHNFLDPLNDYFIIGNQADKGFRGCLGNFTINGELQSLAYPSLLKVTGDAAAEPIVTGCDIQILQSAQPQNALSVGVTVIIVFFVLLICAICFSFTFFKLRKRWQKEKELAKAKAGGNEDGYTNRGMEMQDNRYHQQHHQHQLNNGLHYPKPPAKMKRPDVIETDPAMMMRLPSLRHPDDDDDVYTGQQSTEPAEHYDIENASSIAPSDIDIVYHYKGYRDGGRNSKSLSSAAKKRQRQQQLRRHHNTPLARLSPSSEVSRNTPRILTLGDLSGKPLPLQLAASGAEQQSERSLNISPPVSHVSSAGSRHRRGLTSENVARFNHQRSTPTQKSSLLLNTMDMVSVGSESRRNKSNFDSKTPTLGGGIDSSSASSSDDDNEDDSFTCSEFECDDSAAAAAAKEVSDASMVFSKLSAAAAVQHKTSSSDEEGDGPSPEANGRTWESLLDWTPDYATFSGVFRDIAELSHDDASSANELDFCRPSPLGDRRSEEQYI